MGSGLILCQQYHINKLYLQCKEVILLTARLTPETSLSNSSDVFSATYITISN